LNQPSSGTSGPEIIIHLGQGESTRALPTDELVQFRHYQSLRQQIHGHLETLQTAESSKEYQYPHGSGWTQFIDGSRGAGKSTFLSSVKRGIEVDSELKELITFFNVIDPSRIEQSEMPLLIILQALRKRVDSVLNNGLRLEDYSLREEWRRAFSGVAGGLSLFAKDYHPLNDLDPELFLDWGLERASDSTRLREGLHYLFELACRILRVRALILGFDDADTDSTHAIPLLECIRKYLDTPRVLVLVTGDLELYSLLVQRHFAKTVTGRPDAALDLQRSPKEGDRSAQYLRMIDHLEEQYLLKLFPIRRRMQLQPLWNVLLRDECVITLTGDDGHRIPVKHVVHSIVKRGLRVKTDSDVDLYTEFLLKQPLRTVLQVVERCAPCLGALSPENFNSEDWSPELTHELSRSLQALALTSLYKLSVDTDAIAARELPALIQAVFDLSLQDGDIDTAPYLRPLSADPNIKACFAALAGEIPNFCARMPGTALRYLLRGPGSISLYSLAQPHLEASDKFRSFDPVAQFTSYMGVGRREDSLDWARRATAVMALPFGGNSTRRVVAPGIVGLRRSRKGRPKLELTANSVIQEAINNANGYLPVFALGMIHVVSDTSPRTYGSIYAILGLIEKLITAGFKNIEKAHTVFDRAYPPLTVSAPSWSLKGGTEIEVDEPDEPSGDSGQLKAKQDALWKQVEAWLMSVENLSDTILPSGIFLGKVWTRIYFSLQNAADDLKAAKFATLMEIFALCVLNAFLVEEAEHHMFDSSNALAGAARIDRSNPRTSADHFVKKLNDVKPGRNSFPFTAIMATCPLLLGSLDQRKGYAAALQPLFPNEIEVGEINDLLCPSATFNLMERVSVAGGKSEAENDGTETPARKKRQARAKLTDEKVSSPVQSDGS